MDHQNNMRSIAGQNGTFLNEMEAPDLNEIEAPGIYQKYTNAWYKNVWILKHGTIPKRNTADGHLQPVLQIVNEDIRSGKNYTGATAFKEHVDNSIAAIDPDADNSIHLFSDPKYSNLLEHLPSLNIPGTWMFYDKMSGVAKGDYEYLVNAGAIGRTGRSKSSIGMYSLGIKDFYESFFYMTVTLTRHKDNDGGFTTIIRSNVRQRASSRMRYHVDGHAFAEDDALEAFRQTLIDHTPLKESDLSTIMNCVYPDGKTGTLCLAFGMEPNHRWEPHSMGNYYANSFYKEPCSNFKMFINETEIPIEYKEPLGRTIFSQTCSAFRTNGLTPTGENGKCSRVSKEITHNGKPFVFKMELKQYDHPQYETSKDKEKEKQISVRIVVKGLHVIDVPIQNFYDKTTHANINIKFLVNALKKKALGTDYFDKAKECTQMAPSGTKVICSQARRAYAKFGLYERMIFFIDNPELLMLNKLDVNVSKYRELWFSILNTGFYYAWPELNALSHQLADKSHAFAYLWRHEKSDGTKMMKAGEFRGLSSEASSPWSSKKETVITDRLPSNDFLPPITDELSPIDFPQQAAVQTPEQTPESGASSSSGSDSDIQLSTDPILSSKRVRVPVQRDAGEEIRRRPPKKRKKSPGDNRNHFRKSQKDKAWDQQGGVCENPHCRVKLSRRAAHVDHKDGNASNNSDENCHYLCIPCHAVKSRVETWCTTHQEVFEYSRVESDPVWRSRHGSDITMLMKSQPVLTEEQKNTRKHLIVQWLQSLN